MLKFVLMNQLPPSIILTIAVLTVFFMSIVVAKFAIEDNFTRTRLVMTAFFCFIVATLTISFWEFFFATLPFTIPAGAVGVLAGFLIGVPAAKDRLKREGVRHYRAHFAHIETNGIKGFQWWTLINFYTVLTTLALINLVGFTTVLLHNLKPMALVTSAFGAFLIGSIFPYLWHLWSIKGGAKER
jgi:hypothetical protein